MKPIALLSQTARKVSETKDYTLRAPKVSEDELGVFTDTFNQMLEQIQKQDVEIQASRAEALHASQLKDEFLATLAHELRNPLAPLLNALNVRRLTTPDLKDPLQELMERQLALLVRLIDDLLDIARITRGKLELRRGPTTLQQVLHSAVEIAMPLVDQGGHRLQVQMPSEPVPLHADSMRLAQVFANLLNNAVKYSDAGGQITLIADAGADGIRVSVRDAGIGLSTEQADNVFEIFTQADTAIERARGGLGIGLTLVRRLTEMHGGVVSVSSAGLGQGSEFVVQLPGELSTDVQPLSPRELAPARVDSLPRAEDGRRRRALVVDDNRDAADTLAMMLELIGLDVRCVYDPMQVEASLDSFGPEVLFLDVGMPGRSGYDVARALRARPAEPPVLLVAVTGWGQPEDRRRTREAGFDHHLVKPPELPAILSICARLADAAGPPA